MEAENSKSSAERERTLERERTHEKERERAHEREKKKESAPKRQRENVPERERAAALVKMCNIYIRATYSSDKKIL